MNVLKDPHPVLAPDRLASRRDHLMNEIKTTQAKATADAGWFQRHRRALGVGISAVAGVGALGLGASTVAADGFTVSTQSNGVVAIDLDQTVPVYRGRLLSLIAVEELNRDGKAMVSVANRELACQGVMLYFDTGAEADEYGRGYLQREKLRHPAGSSHAVPVGADPCAEYQNTPNFVPAGVTLGATSPHQP